MLTGPMGGRCPGKNGFCGPVGVRLRSARQRVHTISLFFMVIFILFSLSTGASEPPYPIIKGEPTVALVNGEAITLDEFSRALESIHLSKMEEQKVKKIDYREILDRLITTHLIVQEGKKIGLHELAEAKKMAKRFRERTIQTVLLKEKMGKVGMTEDEAESLYRRSIMEVEIKTALFLKRRDAEKMKSALENGEKFNDLAENAKKRGEAKISAGEGTIRSVSLFPEIVDVILKMEEGDVSPVIKIPPGFVLFHLEGKRFPERGEGKEVVKRKALRIKRLEVIKEYYEELQKKYVKVDRKLQDDLNFESGLTQFEALLSDNRPLVRIEGETPITVGALAEALKEKFFHGISQAIKEKKINVRKGSVLDGLIKKRVYTKEAYRLGIDKKKDLQERITYFENAQVFNAFVSKVIVPSIQVTVDEGKSYYRKHKKDFFYPEGVQVGVMMFRGEKDAEHALESLKKGTDYRWLSQNAEGLVVDKEDPVLKLNGKAMYRTDLPEELKEVLSSAGRGDARLYKKNSELFYIFYVFQVIPERPQPFDVVRDEVAREIKREKLNRGVEEWAAKLRNFSEVKVFMKGKGI